VPTRTLKTGRGSASGIDPSKHVGGGNRVTFFTCSFSSLSLSHFSVVFFLSIQLRFIHIYTVVVTRCRVQRVALVLPLIHSRIPFITHYLCKWRNTFECLFVFYFIYYLVFDKKMRASKQGPIFVDSGCRVCDHVMNIAFSDGMFKVLLIDNQMY
jgi:hypothetical protein